jgi:hypothetical protein
LSSVHFIHTLCPETFADWQFGDDRVVTEDRGKRDESRSGTEAHQA